MIKKTTYKDQVVERIYHLVLDGHYQPGEQLKESVLAREMGISRAPVREALNELIAGGILAYRPQVGCFIARLSPAEIIDAYTARGVLEGFAIMSVRQRFAAADFNSLAALIERMEDAAHRGRRKQVVAVGGDFHDLLVAKSTNSEVTACSRRLSRKLHVLFYRHWPTLYSPAEIGERHRRILQSLVAGDPIAIEQTVREHYIETGWKIAALQGEEPGQKNFVAGPTGLVNICARGGDGNPG
ncbi:MAG TPA: GntR family transcriptional regulator [Desulforhopalus sp.]|nr:GntR family transcriptional regulator [Desulforhopalus sp.]